MSVKLRARFGSVEFEYEGSEDFLKADLPDVLRELAQAAGESAVSQSDASASNGAAQNGSNAGAIPAAGSVQMSTNNIAAKLGVKSGPELVMAACAHLNFVNGKDTFTRKEILEDMKTATSYFEENHNKNLSASLKTLVKDGKLIERSSGVFALHATSGPDLRAKLA